MKRMIVMLVALVLLMASCAETSVIDGETVVPYGLLSKGDKAPCVIYEIPTSNIVVGVLFSQTLFVPAYILALDLYEPVGKEVGCERK